MDRQLQTGNLFYEEDAIEVLSPSMDFGHSYTDRFVKTDAKDIDKYRARNLLPRKVNEILAQDIVDKALYKDKIIEKMVEVPVDRVVRNPFKLTKKVEVKRFVEQPVYKHSINDNIVKVPVKRFIETPISTKPIGNIKEDELPKIESANFEEFEKMFDIDTTIYNKPKSARSVPENNFENDFFQSQNWKTTDFQGDRFLNLVKENKHSKTKLGNLADLKAINIKLNCELSMLEKNFDINKEQNVLDYVEENKYLHERINDIDSQIKECLKNQQYNFGEMTSETIELQQEYAQKLKRLKIKNEFLKNRIWFNENRIVL